MNLLIHVAGWTLLHFLWQGTIVATAAAAALRVIPTRSPRGRYAAAAVALCAMFALPPITASVLFSSASASQFDDATALSVSVKPMVNAVTSAGAAPEAQADRESDGTSASRTLLRVVVGAWLAGVMLCLIRLAGGWRRVAQLHRMARRIGESSWQTTADQLAARIGIRRRVQVVDSDAVDTPTLIGWMRPLVLLPIAALANLSPAQVEAILVHELAHVRRHDYMVNLLQTAAETLLFYHPGVWWVSGRIRAEREHCCDAVAVAMSGNAADYAAALEELETWRAREGGLAIAATGGALLERVRRVLHVPTDDQRPSANLGIMTALVVLLILISGAVQHLPASRVNVSNDPSHVRQVPPPPPPPPPAGSLPEGWQLSETANFEIVYPADLASEVDRIGREAESAYTQIKLDLRHELAFKPRLVLFATRRDMVRALASGAMPGNTEHILLTLDTSPARLRGDVTHEISHVFGFDILPSSRRGDLPAWIPEGLAEHERGEWDSSDASMIAAMVRAGAVPRLTSPGAEGVPGNPRLNVVLGHAAFDYIVSRAGKDGLRRFLLAVRQAPEGGLVNAYATTFGVTAEDFDREFEEYLRKRFGPSPGK